MTILSFLAPIQGLMILLICFITFDTIMAIYVSVRLKGWKSFRSALLRKGMTSKIFLYLGSVILAYMVDIYVMGGSLFGIKLLLAKGLAGVWCYAEIKSCDENSMKLGNRSFFVIVKEFFQKITGYKAEINKIIE
jgi:hypothetical protein